MSRPVRGAFRAAFCVAVLALGCGGRTSGPNPSGVSGSNALGASGVVVGSSSGAATGSTGIGTSGCDINLCSCQRGPDCECTQGLTACGILVTTGCYDLQTDSTHCGSCATECLQSQSCQSGICVPAIEAGSDGMTAIVALDGSCDLCVDAGGGTPPSCAPGGPGMTNCGPGGSGAESCCTSLEVTGGTYYRTYNMKLATSGPPDGGWPDLADPAMISTFRLDKYLVTVGRFRQFVAAWNGGAGWTPPAGSGKHTHLNGGQGLVNSGPGGGYENGWVATDSSNIAPTTANLRDGPDATWTSTSGGQENLPINYVNWYEAYAFCIWDGGFLPSEAEWEYAAAGGGQQLEYPWGSTTPGTACPGAGCQYAIYNCDYPNGSGDCTGVANIAPVGTATLGVGLWGQLDMAGEMLGWNLDWYAPVYVDPCTDCAFLTAAAYRVYRGGGFNFNASFLLPPSRSSGPASYRTDPDPLGLRCARTP